MCDRSPRLGAFLLLLGGISLISVSPAQAGSQHYVLNSGSKVSTVCNGCIAPPARPEKLTGSFDVTDLPVESTGEVVAVTNVQLNSPSVAITGNGFLQRLADGRQAMVLDTWVNG